MKVIIHSTAGIALLTAAAISLSTPQKVEAKEWNMCAWEEIPRSVMKRIVQRSDYADILRRMSENCPDAAFALTNPSTISTSDFVPKRSDERSNGDHGDFNGFSQGGDARGVGPSSGGSTGGGGSSDSSGPGGSGGSSGGGGSSDSSGSGGSGGSSGGGSSSDSESSSASDGSGNTDGSDDGGRGSNANNGGGNGSEGGSPGKGHGANDDE